MAPISNAMRAITPVQIVIFVRALQNPTLNLISASSCNIPWVKRNQKHAIPLEDEEVLKEF